MGFACDAGVARNRGRVGAKEAPALVRHAMMNLAAPSNLTFFQDLGTVEVVGDSLELGQAKLSALVTEALIDCERLLVLGGGHETAFASFSGLKQCANQQRIGIINLDAHLDLRAPSSRGASSGTPFYQIRELDPQQFDYLCLGVAEEANTAALFERAAAWGVNVVSDRTLRTDISEATHQIDQMFARNDVVYLTIDMDVLPHFEAPGVSAPAARGVPLDIIEHLIDVILAHANSRPRRLPLTDIVEVCPRFDQDGVTARVAATLARRLLLS